MTAYIHKMVGTDETLVGVARLHWIYLVNGMMGFAMCMLFAYAINTVMGLGIDLMARTSPAGTIDPILGVNRYVSQFMFVCGSLIFLMYLLKVIGTEVGLTTRRMIFKQGVIFINTHEIDIEEIRGERMDLGWFGRFLNYGYVKLDCRFVEDITTPAIEKPERFIRALHKLRSEASDSVITIAAHPDENGVRHANVARKGPPVIPEMGTVEALNAQQPVVAQPGPSEPLAPPVPVTPPVPVAPPMQPEFPVSPPEIPNIPHAPPGQPQPPMAPPEIPAQPGAPVTPPPGHPPETAVAVDPKVVAQVIQQAMPQIVEQMAAKGLVVQEQANDAAAPDADLLVAFDEASGDPDTKRALH